VRALYGVQFAWVPLDTTLDLTEGVQWST